MAIHAHEVEGQCMDLFKTYVIGKQILDQDSTMFLTFANPFDLLNIWRACETGFSVQLQANCTLFARCVQQARVWSEQARHSLFSFVVFTDSCQMRILSGCYSKTEEQRVERSKNEQIPLFIPRATVRSGHRRIRPMVYI
jgi:hypothetical protein